jgi:hypothetical protein
MNMRKAAARAVRARAAVAVPQSKERAARGLAPPPPLHSDGSLLILSDVPRKWLPYDTLPTAPNNPTKAKAGLFVGPTTSTSFEPDIAGRRMTGTRGKEPGGRAQ